MHLVLRAHFRDRETETLQGENWAGSGEEFGQLSTFSASIWGRKAGGSPRPDNIS